MCWCLYLAPLCFKGIIFFSLQSKYKRYAHLNQFEWSPRFLTSKTVKIKSCLISVQQNLRFGCEDKVKCPILQLSKSPTLLIPLISQELSCNVVLQRIQVIGKIVIWFWVYILQFVFEILKSTTKNQQLFSAFLCKCFTINYQKPGRSQGLLYKHLRH